MAYHQSSDEDNCVVAAAVPHSNQLGRRVFYSHWKSTRKKNNIKDCSSIATWQVGALVKSLWWAAFNLHKRRLHCSTHGGMKNAADVYSDSRWTIKRDLASKWTQQSDTLQAHRALSFDVTLLIFFKDFLSVVTWGTSNKTKQRELLELYIILHRSLCWLDNRSCVLFAVEC